MKKPRLTPLALELLELVKVYQSMPALCAMLAQGDTKQITVEIGTIGPVTKKMKAVNLSQNQLREFPACLLNLQQLQSLRFSDNQLTALPSTIGQLTQLTELVSSCDKR